MGFIKKAASFFDVPTDRPELTQAQLKAFSRQIPLMYAIVIACTITVAYTHYPYAPVELTVAVPAILTLLSLWRAITYFRFRHRELTHVRAVRQLRSTVLLAGVFGVFFTAWAIALYPYGDALTRGHIAFYAAITVFGGVICLMNLRPAAQALTIVAIIPMSAYLWMTHEVVLQAIAVNLMMVAAAIMFVLFHYSQDFAKLIAQQAALEEKQAETQRLSDANFQLANLDSLTSLPNRRSFFYQIEKKIRRGVGEDSGLAVGILDLDGFKPINDIYGHPVGDRLLIEVGQRLLELSGEDLFVARLGGDEFGLIVEGFTSDAELHAVGERVCNVLKLPFDLNGFAARMSGSVGLAKYPTAADTPELLFERADYALYYAKENAAGSVVLFSEEHGAQIREVSVIERRLRDADLEEEMTLAFQPIIDVKGGRVAGVEVLARWTSPVIGTVPPSAFIRSAERAGMINHLTEVLFRKSLEAATDWPNEVYVSFNLSAYDVGMPDCVLRLMNIIQRTGFPPQRLTFEITETAIMQDYDRTLDSLRLLKNLGARIALDDFGTGYSSLSYVRSLPLDRLKIDKSFITEIERDEAARSVVRTILGLCNNLNLECIVEGVETEGQLQILQEMGCRKIQGYLFSRPMDGKAIRRYLQAERRLSDTAG